MSKMKMEEYTGTLRPLPTKPIAGTGNEKPERDPFRTMQDSLREKKSEKSVEAELKSFAMSVEITTFAGRLCPNQHWR
jgi:hypothetical protein